MNLFQYVNYQNLDQTTNYLIGHGCADGLIAGWYFCILIRTTTAGSASDVMALYYSCVTINVTLASQVVFSVFVGEQVSRLIMLKMKHVGYLL